jgi:Ser/Thr protein kinase RdoA (MazF antagonist)
MNKIREILPPDSLAQVPIIYLYDEANHDIIMEDAGRDVVNLKELLKQPTPPSTVTGAAIGRALGEFIARLHVWGKTDQGQSSLDFFDGHPQARDIVAWATYGRLVDTIVGKSEPIPLIHDPPLEVTSEELERISKLAEQGAGEIRSSRETMTMGDFWPGNVLVDLDRDADGSEKLRKLLVVDWEVARPGVAAFDVGQFQAEIVTVRHFNPVCGPATEALDVAFLEGYLSVEPGLDRQKAAQHLAMQLVIWTARVGWEPAEKTRELVKQGLKSITL